MVPAATLPGLQPNVLIPHMNHFIDDDAFSFQSFLQANFSTSKRVVDKTGSSSYSKLLEGPASTMASNVPERADANSAAILGYN